MSTRNPIQLTPDGKRALEQELKLLRDVKRPEQRELVQNLSSEGDVSDNSEYEDVKEELMAIESRIREIENLLEDAVVVESTSTDGVVGFGSTVTIVAEDGAEATWTLVGPQESNPLERKISIASPVGAALIGKREGEEVDVVTPGGETRYTIKSVS